MYTDLIRGLIQDFDGAKLQRPCPEEEIEKAQAYVGYAFAPELKALLRETNGDGWLLFSAEEIMERVRCNREILSQAFEDEEEFREKVDRYIFFAGNGCGDYYGYRVLPDGRTDTTAIYMWEHETFDSHIVARDIPELIARYYHNEI